MTGALLAVTSRAAKSFEMIIIARVLVGINAGMSFVCVSASKCVYVFIKLTLNNFRLTKKAPVCFAGVSMNVQPMYFGESAPKHLRGAVSLSSAVFTAFGVVLGQVVGIRYAHYPISSQNRLFLYSKMSKISTVTLGIIYLQRDSGQRAMLAVSSCQ